MNRQRILTGLLALALVFAGGLYAQNIYAGPNCGSHAKAKTADATTDATVTKANVEEASSKACCPSGKAANAQLTGAGCATKTDAKTASAHEGCATKADAKLAGAKQCTSADKAKYAGSCDLGGELMTAEATVAKLAHCGIDIRSADAETLAAKLADKGCGTYTSEQWATMIKSAKALDAEKVDAQYASAKSEKVCSSENCPMSLVANEMGAKDSKTN